MCNAIMTTSSRPYSRAISSARFADSKASRTLPANISFSARYA